MTKNLCNSRRQHWGEQQGSAASGLKRNIRESIPTVLCADAIGFSRAEQ